MGDGEHDATLGRRGASGAGSNGQGIARNPRRALAAAPWERFSTSEPDNGAHLWQVEPPAEGGMEPRSEPAPDTERTASHASGAISVADLIAKIGAPLPDRPSRHHVAPDTDSSDDVADRPDELLDTPGHRHPGVLARALSPNFPSSAPPTTPTTTTSNPTARPPPGHRRLNARQNRSGSAGRRLRRSPGRKGPRPRAEIPPPDAARRALACGVVCRAGTGHDRRGMALEQLEERPPQGRQCARPAFVRHRRPRRAVRRRELPDRRYGLPAGANADMGAGDTEDAGGARSDTVMLVNIPANRKRVVAVSFPRDLAITPMQCEAWNPETGKYGPIYDPKTGKTGPRMVYTETKLNSTFAFGGPKCLVKEIQKLSGLSINRFIAIDFVGFARMVEALGGVEVCTTTPLKDYELGTVLDHAGRQVINGATALNYVRARQVTTESNGDYGRIKRQQLFLSSLLRSLISEDTLLNPNKLNKVVNMFVGNSYVDNVKTKDLVQFGQSLQHMAAGHVTFVTVPTGVTDQNGDEPPAHGRHEGAVRGHHQRRSPAAGKRSQRAEFGDLNLADNRAQPKKPPPPSATPETRREQIMTTSPHEVTVQVSNATAQSGLAATATSQLKRNGFNVMTPDDYPSSLRTTTVFFSPGNEQAAATVASAFANRRSSGSPALGQSFR